MYSYLGISEQAVLQNIKRRNLLGINISQMILEIDSYRKKHPGCGLKKLYYQLNISFIGRDRFIEVCKQLGYQIKQPIKRTRTTISGNYRWPNLIEGMLVTRINQVWQTDITYYRVKETFYYISFIMDVYSRLIISYELSNSLAARANINALQKAFMKRGNVEGLIHHSDRGTQFGANKYLSLLRKNGGLSSMGNISQDNAYVERLNGTIKNEYLEYRDIQNEKDLKRWLRQAVSQYNGERIHDGLPPRMSPKKFEEKLLTWTYQQRPKVIIYAGGRQIITGGDASLDDLPTKALQAHICPVI